MRGLTTKVFIVGIAVESSASLSVGGSGNGAVNRADTSSSQKCGDLEYDSNACPGVDGFAGANLAPITLRRLPASQ